MSQRPNIFSRLAALLSARKPVEPEYEAQVAHVDPMTETSQTDETYGEDGHPHFAIDRRQAKFQIGEVVKHRMFGFRGVIFDVDPVFANSDEWYEAIPEHLRPPKDQPYYHLFAENDKTHYVAYVSEGNLLIDDSDTPVSHPDIPFVLDRTADGYALKREQAN